MLLLKGQEGPGDPTKSEPASFDVFRCRKHVKMRLPGVMDICMGLVGPKAKVLKIHWFYLYLLKGQAGHGDPKKIPT